MSEQPPIGDDSRGSHSMRGEAHDSSADSTQSNVVAFNPPQHSIGYGRPPIHSRFKPGQSGNAKGRPKGSRNVMTELRKVYTETIVIQVRGKKRRLTRIAALALSQWDRGIKGNERATQAAIANAKVLGVFDETETDESSLTDCLSKETIQQLSYDALQELIDIERARLKKTQN